MSTDNIITHNAEVCTSLEHDLFKMDIVLDDILERRKRIIDKLEAAVMLMQLDLDKDDSETIEAKMQAINSYSKLLTDQEKNTYTRVSAKLKQKDIDSREALQVSVSEIIRNIQEGNINMPKVVLTEEERNKTLEMVYEDKGCVVIDEELIESSDTSDITTDHIKAIMNGDV